MSDRHKAALAQGRTEGRAVRQYLDALQAYKPRRGRRRTSESIESRIAEIDSMIDEVDSVTALKLVQERMDLQNEYDGMAEGDEMSELEAAFVKVALSYSERQGITYSAWRQIGVPASVLRKAGIRRTR